MHLLLLIGVQPSAHEWRPYCVPVMAAFMFERRLFCNCVTNNGVRYDSLAVVHRRAIEAEIVKTR
jgi:hypothetical protein